jgi:hypothetical protein
VARFRDPPDFARYQPAVAPAWLSKPWGRVWGETFGAMKDLVRAGFIFAVRSGFISIAPTDHLVAHGWDRDLERGPIELAEDYRARLMAAFETYGWTGTDKAIVDSLKAFGLWSAVIRDRGRAWVRDDAESLGGRRVELGATAFTHDNNEPGDVWARMWVVIDLTFENDPPDVYETYAALAVDHTTYQSWADGLIAWGVVFDRRLVDLIRRLVKKWTQSGALVVEIVAIARGRSHCIPLADDYTELPAETLNSYVLHFEGW